MSCPRNLMVIEFTESVADTEIDQVAMFNSELISEERVRNHIAVFGTEGYHSKIVFMTKEQYESLKGVTSDKTDQELLNDLRLEQKETM